MAEKIEKNRKKRNFGVKCHSLLGELRGFRKAFSLFDFFRFFRLNRRF